MNVSEAQRRRLEYYMLFRVGVVTLLLASATASQWALPPGQPTPPKTTELFGLIGATYLWILISALWLRRSPRFLDGVAWSQIAMDLIFTTFLVQTTGGPDSGFVFLYLLVILSAAFLLGRAAVITAVCAVVLYLIVSSSKRWNQIHTGGEVTPGAMREMVRSFAVNLIALIATGVLAARLAVELRLAGERLQSQDTRLRDLAALHQDVIHCLTSGLVTVSLDGIVLTYNQAAAEIIDADIDMAIGQPMEEVIPALRPLVDALSAEAELRRGEIAHRRKNGEERILGVSLSPLVDSQGETRGRIVNFQDLTDLRRMENVVNRTERLAAIGRLAAGVAHEIRNPLAAISGSIELLSQAAPDGVGAFQKEERRELMAIVLREVTRLNDLIANLLDFARPQQSVSQTLDLSATLTEMLRVFEHDKNLDGTRIELHANHHVWVEVDANQLRQVVWNLVRNACEASPAGKPVSIEVRQEDDEVKWAVISVVDGGPGIPVEHRARIFEPFFSTKQGGTGLGLATVHRIVEEHRGRIDVEEVASGGTAFVVRFPLAKPVPIVA